MGDVLKARRATNQQRLDKLRSGLAAAEEMAGDAACVYVTGSFGRGEASDHSDLDAFIVGKSVEEGGLKRRALSRLDEICIKADLIEVCREQGFPEFDRDGAFLSHHTIDHLVETLGKPEDDAANTFTARLLLLLESAPLLGGDVYNYILDEVIAAYWRDYQDHRSDFMPAYLANDVLRLWRTFCINYEARTQTEPIEKKAKRKLKNYKLKHSRLLTCYSALAYLLVVYKANGTVHVSDAREMIHRSPTERLEHLAADGNAGVKTHVKTVLERYEAFLGDTAKDESTLVEEFMDPEKVKGYFAQANDLGNGVFDLLSALGDGSAFYRLLVV